MLHEVLQLLTHLLLGIMQAPQPGSSSSSSRARASSRPNPYSWEDDVRVSPAAAASIWSGLIAVLVPAVTCEVMRQASTAPTSNSTASSSSSSTPSNSNGNSKSTLAATWVPLLLRLTAALEQAMRFEAQWGLSQAELQASPAYHFWGNLAGTFPQGNAWGAASMLLSTGAHANIDRASALNWLESTARASAAERTATAGPSQHRDIMSMMLASSDSNHQPRPALLQWMLDSTPTRQLPAVQQRVLSMLCTAAKVCRSAEGSPQLAQVAEAYDFTFRTAWGVLGRLLPQPGLAAPSSGNAAATLAGDRSSSSGSSSTSGSGEGQGTEGSPLTTAQKNPAGSASSQAGAALPWLSLMGRCFLEASQQMSSIIKQCTPDPAPQGSTQQQGLGQLQRQQQQDHAARASLSKLIIICDLAADILPRCSARLAVLMAAAADRPIQQLPQQRAGQLSTGAHKYTSLDEALSVSDQEQQQLQSAGQQLAEHCSSMRIDPAAVHESTWALAEAAAAAAPVFLGVKTCIATSARGLGDVLGGGMLLHLLRESGLTLEHADAANDSVRQGPSRVSEATAAALLHNPDVQVYMQQLKAAGLALSTLPTAAVCNNPQCSSLSGVSEQQGVQGKACRCSGCRLAFYCQRSCQKQHWAVHKPVCKAVQAAAAAAPGAAAAGSGESI
jgi:hypothetical protein